MNLEQVTKLLDAGFTADEIRQMESGQQPQQQSETQPEKQPETQPEKPSEQQPEQHTEPETNQQQETETDTRITALENSIKSLVKTIQQSNLRNTMQDGGNNKTMQEITDAAMASLIRPEKKGD